MIERKSLKQLCREQLSVKPRNLSYRQKLILILVTLFLLGLILFPLLFTKQKKTDQTKIRKVTHFESLLQTNLAHIQNIQQSVYKPTRKNRDGETSLSIKQMMLRQNAPTRMYIFDNKSRHYAYSSNFLEKNEYTKFANQPSHSNTIYSTKLLHPGYTVPQGELIHAVLETAIDSDLPGMIRAVVSHPVYAYIGERILIPEGARLIGQYASKTVSGINRVMIIWQRILLPNGVSIQLDSPATDILGSAGMAADSVNSHFLQRFGQASLLSIIGATTASYYSTQQYQAAIAQSFQSAANNNLQQSISVKPTLNIHQGARVNVFVAHDLDFYQH